MSPAQWPLGFATAVGAARQVLRCLPCSLVKSQTTYRLVQPISNRSSFFGFPSVMLPREVEVRSTQIRGVPGEWLLPRCLERPEEAGRFLLWVHGGAFAFLSSGTHRRFLAQVAARTQIPVFCINYRKPPEFSFPIPGRDVLNVYEHFREQYVTQKLFLGGDSAGGNLALHVAHQLAQPKPIVNPPEGLVLLSPWVDLSDFSSESWQEQGGVDFIPAHQARWVAEHYAGDISLDDVRVSPGLRTDWSNLPPVLMDYGECEVFRSQIERLVTSMTSSGAQVDIGMAKAMVHTYPLLDFLWHSSEGPFETYFERLVRFLCEDKSTEA